MPPRSRRSTSIRPCTSITPRPCCRCRTACPSSRTSRKRSAARARRCPSRRSRAPGRPHAVTAGCATEPGIGRAVGDAGGRGSAAEHEGVEMIQANPASTARIAGHPIHPMLVPFPIVCFTGALLTDIAYARTADIMWSNFCAWLLAAGIIMGVLAALAGMIDFIGNRRVRAQKPAWPHLLGNLVVLALALWNTFVHSRDAWTSVMPTGLILSALTVAVMLVTAGLGGSLVYRHGVGVSK